MGKTPEAADHSESFGRFIQRVRQQRGMSQVALADAIGRRPGYLSMVETEKIDLPPADFISATARVLHVPERELLKRLGFLQEEEAEDACIPFPPDDLRYRIVELLGEVEDAWTQQLLLTAVEIAAKGKHE